MKSIKNWTKANKVVAVCATAAVVCAIAGIGTAFAINGNGAAEAEPHGTDFAYTADPIGVEGLNADTAEAEVTDEVPEGAVIVEDADAPEGTVAVKDASGNVSYMPAAKAEAAVSNGTASRPSAGSSNSGSTGGSSAATPAPAPEAPKHVCSASVPKTVVDQAAWTEYIPGTTNICVNCNGLDCGQNATVCPNCGKQGLCHVRYNKDVIEHPAVTHTEWYCTCGAKM